MSSIAKMTELEAFMAEKTAIIERRIMAADERCPEAVRMYLEVIYNYDTKGDGTWPLRQVRDIHVTLIRALMKTYKCHDNITPGATFCGF